MFGLRSVVGRFFQPDDGFRPGVPVETLAASSASPKLVNVKAEDYATPEKYLEGAEIPTYIQFQSNMVTDEDLKPGMVRQLEVDKRLTLPTRTHIRFLITGQDVLHSWSVPSLGIKSDATPGRLNRVTTFIQREGVFYGQCSELCGALHGYMPIVVEAVSPETYAAHARKWYKD
uniref:Cytochrome c oxidase polypeptide II n=1 Tax=Noctiluca scintillans TaxID=2966 RepID=A0A7S1F5B1_NOCSC|mmetsp:Transcript_33379/g.89326  ORF Transcript_33379/g.89326 Transcript_33379/m.89326 type:complete len:174 (+) Transcript_33379:53-574(+)